MKLIMENFRMFIKEGMMTPTSIDTLPEEAQKLVDILSSPSDEPLENLLQVLELNEMTGNPLPIRNHEMMPEGDSVYIKLFFNSEDDRDLWWNLLRKAGVKRSSQEVYDDYSMTLFAGIYHQGQKTAEAAIYINNPMDKWADQ